MLPRLPRGECAGEKKKADRFHGRPCAFILCFCRNESTGGVRGRGEAAR
jgi:hypothetical protein